MRIFLFILFSCFVGVSIAQTVSYTCTDSTHCTKQTIYNKPVKILDLQARINSLTQALKALQAEQSQLNAAEQNAQNNAVQPPANQTI